MATEVLLAVLFAAVMHACYHAIIKLGDDKIAALGLIAAFSDPGYEPLFKKRGVEMP